MDTTGVTTIEFTLTSADGRERVAVRLRGGGDRWLAQASSGGAANTALAPTARLALAAALESLPARTVRELLADVALYGPSAEVQRRSRPA